jgi:S-DNA-T family DNA segregation ATPase FtsK/SpoIIIE
VVADDSLEVEDDQVVGEENLEPEIVAPKFTHVDAKAMAEREQQVDAERLEFIPLGDGSYQLPPINLLDYDESTAGELDRRAMLELSAKLTKTLENYGVKGEVVAIRPGPVVTMYEFAPAPGTRINKIVNLTDDLAMSLEALRVRIVAPIPGKAAVGIEVPNRVRETVYLKEIIASDSFQSSKLKLPLALGKDIEGGPSVVDLAKMPHLLVAGTTGSGKSVSVNSMITSLLYNSTPEEVRMIMVDPKMLELSIYEGVPHLLLPVVTDPKKANLALRWAVEEMERRYDLLAGAGVRDLHSYNTKMDKLHARWEADRLRLAAEEAERIAEQEEEVEVTQDRQMPLPGLGDEPKRLPYIVVVIDEFADLMMCAAKEVETSVARIAQKARAAGIHLILATQRPSVDVITGLIKANFPSRAAFRVTSKVDSRTILDQQGAEALLGAGDMLFSDRGASPRRLHGCFVDEDEISRVVDFLKTQGKPVYNLDIIKPRDEDGGPNISPDEEVDEMYDRAVAIVAETNNVSISMIQRKLRIGYNRAARIVEHMEVQGVVSPPDNTNKREVLINNAA